MHGEAIFVHLRAWRGIDSDLPELDGWELGHDENDVIDYIEARGT